MNERSPENISLDGLCPSCKRRVWYRDDPRKSNRVYIPPKWFRMMFKYKLGRYSLGNYYLHRCEVCGKTVAVFPYGKGLFEDAVVVLYSCTLLSVPLGPGCKESICYGCDLKKGELYVEKR